MKRKVALAKSRPGLGKSGDLTAKSLRFARAAQTGEFIPVSAADIKKLWGVRFAESEIDALVIPRRTLARRKAGHEPLTAGEADKAFRLARIATEADRVFGDPAKADRWLRAANPRLANQAPMSLLKTEAGAHVVSELLGQIDHGMFS